MTAIAEFTAGLLVGLLISGSIFMYVTIKHEDKEESDSVKAMRDYIRDLEQIIEVYEEKSADKT